MTEVAPACRFVWHNGEIKRAEDAKVPIWTNALHYGTGVFEGIRCYPNAGGAAVFRLGDHMARLHRSAAFYSMALPFSSEVLSQATVELLKKEEYTGASYVRPLAFFGEGPPQLAVRQKCPVEVMIMTRPLGAFLGEENYRRGVRLTVSSWKKIDRSTIPTTAKGSGQYLNSVLAAHEAIDRGHDDALLLTVEGTVSECTGANIFFVKDGVLYTNDESSSILLGITRDSILRISNPLGIGTVVKTFSLEELQRADEVFVTGTAAEVTPVREISGQTFEVGPITRALQTAYKDVVEGRDPRFEAWLTPL